MSIILNKLNEKNTFWDNDDSSHPIANLTGFNGLDIMASNLETDIYGLPRINAGLFPRIVTMIGESTAGKTTFTIQIAAAIIDAFRYLYNKPDLGEIIMHDIEENTTPDRYRMLTRWSNSRLASTLQHIPGDTSVLDVLNLIRYIAGFKEKNKDLRVRTGFLDDRGNEVLIYPPTVVVIDSIAQLTPEGVKKLEFNKEGEVKELDALMTNMDGARDSKSNTAFLKSVKSFLGKYNIILIPINHLAEDISTKMWDMPKKYLNTLKPGQKLKGGKEQIFQAFTILNVAAKAKITDRDPKYGDKIRGTLVHVTYLKNKNGVEGYSFPIVFDMKTGYNPILSDFEYLAEEKWGMQGSSSFHLDILPEVKFTRKNIVDIAHSDPILCRALSFTARTHMISKLHYNGLDLPNLEAMSARPYEERAAFLLQNTTPYPGMFHHEADISDDITRLLSIGGNFTPIGNRYLNHNELINDEGIEDDDYTMIFHQPAVDPALIPNFDKLDPEGFTWPNEDQLVPFEFVDNDDCDSCSV